MWVSLVALAGVVSMSGCAARTPYPYPQLANIMDCRYEGYCFTEAKGTITKSALRVPEVQMPPAQAKLSFIIPDKCKEWGRELAGVVVHACDADVLPTLTLTQTGVGRARVLRHGALLAPANIYMWQYCV